MDLHSNYAFWSLKNGLLLNYPSLDYDLDTEILVIGGGITGALIAYQLMKTGRNVVLVDKRDVCTGSSAASTALLQYEIDVPLHQLIEMRGERCAVDSYKNCENAIFNLQKLVSEIQSDCHFQFKKSIYFTRHKKDIEMLQKEFDARQKHGFAVKWMSEKEINELQLKAVAAIASESGAVMDPHKLANDLLSHCVKLGMKVFDRTEVEKIKKKNGLLYATTTNKRTAKAKHIIHCTGYESTKNLNKKLVNIKSTYALISESLIETPAAFKNHIFWDTASPYLYFRATHDNRLIVGGGDEEYKDAKTRDALLNQKQRFLVSSFNKVFPDITFKPDYVWAGTFGETPDGLPYIGRPNPAVNEHYVLGFGGNGITYSVMAMDAIEDSINGNGHIFLKDYSFDR